MHRLLKFFFFCAFGKAREIRILLCFGWWRGVMLHLFVSVQTFSAGINFAKCLYKRTACIACSIIGQSSHSLSLSLFIVSKLYRLLFPFYGIGACIVREKTVTKIEWHSATVKFLQLLIANHHCCYCCCCCCCCHCCTLYFRAVRIQYFSVFFK